MPILNNPQKVFHKGFENFTVAVLLEVGYASSEYPSREEYFDALEEENDAWKEEYEAWRDSYYGEDAFLNVNDMLENHDPLIAYRY